MAGWTQCSTEYAWGDVLTVWYCIVDDTYQQLEREYGCWRRRGPAPRFSDSEVITIALLCDTCFDGHEARTLHYVREHQLALFPNLLSNGRFNCRRTQLAQLIEQIRQVINRQYNLVPPADWVRMIDSLPIPLCTYQRSSDCETIAAAAQESNRSIKEYIGRSAKDHAYFAGCRLVVSMTLDRHIDRYSLVPASPHDSTTMEDLIAEVTDCTFLADNAYRRPQVTQEWLEHNNTVVLAPPRRNSPAAWPSAYRRWHARQRRQIETGFSILGAWLGLQRPGSRSWLGLQCRVATKVLAYTLLGLTTDLFNSGALTL